jgi:dipeptidyl aminopeptidase/acylaminoacyl peptidase
LAEQQARFQVDAVSPVMAAARITTPVMLIHGDADTETSSDHSRRVFAALRGQKRLILVSGARHNGSLRGEVWDGIARWLDALLVPRIDAQPTGDRRHHNAKGHAWISV